MQGFWSRAPQSRICSSCRRCLRRAIHASARRPMVATRPLAAREAEQVAQPEDEPRYKASDLMDTDSKGKEASNDERKDFSSLIRRHRRESTGKRRRHVGDFEVPRILREAENTEPHHQDYAWSMRRTAVADMLRALATSDIDRDCIPVVDTISESPSPFGVIRGINKICVSEHQLVQFAARAEQRQTHLSRLHTHFGMERRWWAQNPMPNAGLDAVMDALFAEEEESLQPANDDDDRSLSAFERGQRKQKEQREPQTPLQFEKMANEASCLADDLINEAYRMEFPDDLAARQAAKDELISPHKALVLLRSDGYPRYQHPGISREETADARVNVNRVLRRIFDEWEAVLEEMHAPDAPPVDVPLRIRVSVLEKLFGKKRKPTMTVNEWYREEIKVWVSKICFNLLVAKVPPGIHNYNALILGFTRVGEHSLAQMVIDSFLLNSQLKPSQQTTVCILHHYRAQGDLVGFYRILRRIVGVDGRGLKIRQRVQETDARGRPNQYTLSWSRHFDVAINNELLTQRVTIDAAIFDAVLSGLLSLDHVRHASVVFSSFLYDCREVSTSVLNQFINYVLDTADSFAARILVTALVENPSLITPLLMTDRRYSRRLALKMRLLLSVASTPWKHFEADGEQQQFQKRTRFLQRAGTWRLTQALFIAETFHYLHHLGHIVGGLNEALLVEENVLPEPLEDILQRFSVQLDYLGQQPHRVAKEVANYRTLAKFKNLDDEVTMALNRNTYVLELCLEAVSEKTAAAVPPVYLGFLRIRSVPFRIRVSSYLDVIERAMAATEYTAEAAFSAHVSLLERHVNVDTEAAGRLLERKFKKLVLKSFTDEERAAAGLDELLRLSEGKLGRIPLEAFVEARWLRDQGVLLQLSEEQQAGLDEKVDSWKWQQPDQAIQLVTRNPYYMQFFSSSMPRMAAVGSLGS